MKDNYCTAEENEQAIVKLVRESLGGSCLLSQVEERRAENLLAILRNQINERRFSVETIKDYLEKEIENDPILSGIRKRSERYRRDNKLCENCGHPLPC